MFGFYNLDKSLDGYRATWSKGLGLSVGIAKDKKEFNAALLFLDTESGLWRNC